jgi:prepilin-type N-terminal cleavage/methylation domain-containing protein
MKKNFTFIELLIVIAVIGILGGLILTAVSKFMEKSEKAENVRLMQEIQIGISTYYDKQGKFPYYNEGDSDYDLGVLDANVYSLIKEYVDFPDEYMIGTDLPADVWGSRFMYAPYTAYGAITDNGSSAWNPKKNNAGNYVQGDTFQLISLGSDNVLGTSDDIKNYD